jgi:hypothetical protein
MGKDLRNKNIVDALKSRMAKKGYVKQEGRG